MIQIERPSRQKVQETFDNKTSFKKKPDITITFPQLREADWYRAGNKAKFDKRLLADIEKSINSILDETKFGNQGDRRDLFVSGLMRRFKQVLNAE